MTTLIDSLNALVHTISEQSRALKEMKESIADAHAKIARANWMHDNTVIHGKVTDVDPEKALYRQEMGEDADGNPVKSPWIPYSQIAGTRKVHSAPSVGQQMTMLAPGGSIERAFALPLTWSDLNPSPSTNGDEDVDVRGKTRTTQRDADLKREVDGVTVHRTKQSHVLTIHKDPETQEEGQGETVDDANPWKGNRAKKKHTKTLNKDAGYALKVNDGEENDEHKLLVNPAGQFEASLFNSKHKITIDSNSIKHAFDNAQHMIELLAEGIKHTSSAKVHMEAPLIEAHGATNVFGNMGILGGLFAASTPAGLAALQGSGAAFGIDGLSKFGQLSVSQSLDVPPGGLATIDALTANAALMNLVQIEVLEVTASFVVPLGATATIDHLTVTSYVSLPAGSASNNVGPLGGDLFGALPNPAIANAAVTNAKMAAGAAAANVGTLGGDLSGTLPAPTIADGAVTTLKVADAAITPAKLSKTYAEINNNATFATLNVTAGIVCNAIDMQGANIANGNVGGSPIASHSWVTGNNYAQLNNNATFSTLTLTAGLVCKAINTQGSTITTGGGNLSLGTGNVTGLSLLPAGAGGVPVYCRNSDGALSLSPSSQRFKTNIRTLDDDVSWFYALRPVVFNYRKHDENDMPTDEAEDPINYGLIAEEVEQLNDDLVGYDENGEPFYIRYQDFNGLYIRVLQDQKREIDALKAEIDALKSAVA